MKATKQRTVKIYDVSRLVGDDMWVVVEHQSKPVAWATSQAEASELAHILKRDTAHDQSV